MTAFTPAPGSWAVITGAGSGIGRMLALHFAAKGLKVAVLDIVAERAQETLTLIEAAGGAGRVEGCDVSDETAIKALADRFASEGLALSLLWINAGVGSAETVGSGKPGVIRWLYEVNVLGAIWTAQAFLPMLRANGGDSRHIGITASSASVVPVQAPFTLYATTKQATAAVGEALMAELADEGIGVTILCPGILNTEIWNSGRARPERHGGARELPENVGAHWRAQPAPDVLAGPIDAVLAEGGGWCIVPTESVSEPLMTKRHAEQRKGLRYPD
jgi:NAD(P)-dependent dehydrogenase (short-subunit alcohol dehydrogenase family)